MVSQTIQRNLVAKNTLDVALVPLAAINPTTPTNPTKYLRQVKKQIAYSMFSMDFDDSGKVVYLKISTQYFTQYSLNFILMTFMVKKSMVKMLKIYT